MSTNKVIDHFLRPPVWLCIAFGFVIAPLIALWLWSKSFSWLFDFNYHFNLSLCIGILTFLLLQFVDFRFKTVLSRYASTSLALLVVLGSISYPLRDTLLKKSAEDGEKIRQLVDQFNLEFGKYPTDLSHVFFTAAPKRSWIGSPYVYRMAPAEDAYSIEYVGFYGYWHFYSSKTGQWSRHD